MVEIVQTFTKVHSVPRAEVGVEKSISQRMFALAVCLRGGSC